MRGVSTSYMTRMAVATMSTAAAGAAETVRIPTCATRQVITMPGRTAQTTGGRVIMRDLQAVAAMVTTTQGEGVGYLLGEVRSIAIGIAIEVEISRDRGRGRTQVGSVESP